MSAIPGRPGPAPTRTTEPASAVSAGVSNNSKSLSVGNASGAAMARSVNFSQSVRRRRKGSASAAMRGRHERAASAQRAKPARDQRLDLGADRLAENRRSAVGRDADDERRAVDDRAEREIAKGRPVDDVDRHAGGAGGSGEARGFRVVGAFGDGDGGAGAIGRRPRTLVNDNSAGAADSSQARAFLRRASARTHRRGRRRPRGVRPSMSRQGRSRPRRRVCRRVRKMPAAATAGPCGPCQSRSVLGSCGRS